MHTFGISIIYMPAKSFDLKEQLGVPIAAIDALWFPWKDLEELPSINDIGALYVA